MAGNARVWDLREQQNVIIPDGVEKIWNYWFYGTSIESVEIPASVREICPNAFCRCKMLRRVFFAAGSRLEKLERACFQGCSLEEFQTPPGLRKLNISALYDCESLKRLELSEGLEVLVNEDGNPEEASQRCWLEETVLPSTLKEVSENAFSRCDRLRAAYTESNADIRPNFPSFVAVLSKHTVVGNVFL